jgi:cytochrome c oxidase cbb3-type subunit 3
MVRRSPYRLLRWLPLLQLVLVVLLGVASGTLECGGARATAQESRGERLYGRMCAVCHGPTGQGYAADQAPSLTHGDFLAAVEDGYLRLAILEGRGGTTMSAWSAYRSGPLSTEDATAVVAYLRTYADRPPMTLDNRPPVAGDASRGADLFARECAGCHGPHGDSGPFVGIGGFDLLRAASDGFLRQAIRDGRAGTVMPSFGARLGDAGIDDVLALLRGWQRTAPLTRKPPAKLPPLPLGAVPIHPNGPEPVGFTATPQSTKIEVVKSQLDAGARMALLDARAPSDYIGEHITGGVSVPFYEPEPYFDQLPKDAWLVCYCSCPSAESGTLAKKLLEHGFTKVTVLEEGLRVWKAKKYPTNQGFEP